MSESTETTGRSRQQKLAANFALLVGTVLLLLVVFELSLRLTGFSFVLYPQDIEFGRPDPVMIESGFLEDDDVFWVTRDYPQKLTQLATEPPQWVFLGDSCTHLGHYDEALARRFEGRTGQPLSYANLAVAGWSSYQGRQQLLRDVVPLAPKVVSFYFGWNDHWIGFGIEDKNVGRVKQIFSSRWSQLRLTQLVTQAVVAWGARETAYPNRVAPQDFSDNLRAMVQASRQAGIHPVLITAGTSHRIGAEPSHLTQRWLRNLDDLVPLHQEYVDRVRQVAAEGHAILCDAAQEFAGLPTDELSEIFMQDGIHLTARGDERLAEILERCVVEAGLLDGELLGAPFL